MGENDNEIHSKFHDYYDSAIGRIKIRSSPSVEGNVLLAVRLAAMI